MAHLSLRGWDLGRTSAVALVPNHADDAIVGLASLTHPLIHVLFKFLQAFQSLSSLLNQRALAVILLVIQIFAGANNRRAPRHPLDVLLLVRFYMHELRHVDTLRHLNVVTIWALHHNRLIL